MVPRVFILLKKLIVKILVVVISIIVTFGMPLTFLGLTPIYLFRFFIFKIAKYVRPDLGKMLSTRSMVSAIDDLYGRPNINLVVPIVMSGDIPVDNVRSTFLEKVINFKGKNGELVRPEMKQYMTSWMGFYFWKNDPTFDIKNHVNYYSEPGYDPNEEVDEDRLLQLNLKLIAKPHKRKRPLWEMIIIRNYKPKLGPEALEPDVTRIVLAFRIHHALADGFSIVRLLLHLADQTQLKMPKANFESPNNWKKFKDIISFVFRVPFEFVPQIVNSFDCNEWKYPEWKMTKNLKAATTERISIDRLKAIRSFHGVSLTSVIIAAICGGIRNYMIQKGVKVPKRIHCGTALPVSNHPTDKMRNHMTMCIVNLPVGDPDPVRRLKMVHDNLETLKRSTVPMVFFMTMPLIGGLFGWMVKLAVRNTLTTALLTSMPGPKETIHFMNTHVTDIAVGSGLLPGNTAMGFTTLSYNGMIKIVGGADQKIIPDDESIKELINFIVQELNVFESYVNV